MSIFLVQLEFLANKFKLSSKSVSLVLQQTDRVGHISLVLNSTVTSSELPITHKKSFLYFFETTDKWYQIRSKSGFETKWKIIKNHFKVQSDLICWRSQLYIKITVNRPLLPFRHSISWKYWTYITFSYILIINFFQQINDMI